MEELERIWHDLKARGEWYCGCTSAELHRIYGDNVYHKPGYGWYKLTAR